MPEPYETTPSDPRLLRLLAAAQRLMGRQDLALATLDRAIRLAPSAKGEIFVVNLSGRGDKDIDIYREHFPELDA